MQQGTQANVATHSDAIAAPHVYGCGYDERLPVVVKDNWNGLY